MTQGSAVFETKRVHDPIHGTIYLSELETEIINSRAFQRLRNIKQLGLAHYVFPGAEYSRFTHSLGVCHLCSKLYDAKIKVEATDGDAYDEREKQKIRLAGLLHDIGHYPFSHAMEEAIKEYVKQKNDSIDLFEPIDADDITTSQQGVEKSKSFHSHESVGRDILLNDGEISDILKKHGFSPEEIFSLFLNDSESESDQRISNIISSDLDADRLDYLLRSAYHVGLPYGSNDLEYVLGQITIDSDDNICLSPKALRTVDHFLLCRYFDYSQVIFHKTVVGFEEVLKNVIIYLIDIGVLEYLSDDNLNFIKNKDWYEYDDSYVMAKIREYSIKVKTPSTMKLMMRSIIRRIPPKEIVKLEMIGDQHDDEETFKMWISDTKRWEKHIVSEFNIHKECIIVWNNHGFEITKMSRLKESSKLATVDSGDRQNYNQSVKIYNRFNDKSDFIVNRDDSLMRHLSDKALYSVRLFILFDPEKYDSPESLQQIRNKIQSSIQKEWDHHKWK